MLPKIYTEEIATDGVPVFVKYRVKIVISCVIAGVQVIPYCAATLCDALISHKYTTTSGRINAQRRGIYFVAKPGAVFKRQE